MVTGVLEMDADNSLHKQAAEVSNGRGESSLSRSDASEAQPNAVCISFKLQITKFNLHGDIWNYDKLLSMAVGLVVTVVV